MPVTKIQDPEFTVGNASRNDPRDVKYVKDLLFAIPSGIAGALTEEERRAIKPSSGDCEPAMVKALARIQKEHVRSEAPSGGRVVAWSNTLALLEKNGAVGKAYAAWEYAGAALVDLAKKSGAILDQARAKALGGKNINKIRSIGSGNAGTKLEGSVDSGGATETPVLHVDLEAWLSKLMPRKTPFKVTGGAGIQGSVKAYGAGGGFLEITNTDTSEKRQFNMYFASAGASIAPVSFSYASAEMDCGPLSHLYQGGLHPYPVTMNSFIGPFVALSATKASPGDFPLAKSVTLYFFGLTYFDLVAALNRTSPSWETLQKAAGIGIAWGTANSTPDVGVQIQMGKLIGDWFDKMLGLDQL